ncbi:aldehyde dehydrogenase family protein, partial [Arthrobacter deserti]|nr:aldehyde dehydrogenase family protein [Arthrobacter deserti]
AASVQQGANVVAGGGDTGDGGYGGGMLAEGAFVAPTVLEVSGGTNPCWREEFFGPVLTVRRAASAGEAFALANDSEFGLSAAVFTRDIARALEAVDELDVGILHINSESAGAGPHVPFGGAKESGYGPKEQGTAAREFFTHTTTVYLRGGAAWAPPLPSTGCAASRSSAPAPWAARSGCSPPRQDTARPSRTSPRTCSPPPGRSWPPGWTQAWPRAAWTPRPPRPR